MQCQAVAFDGHNVSATSLVDRSANFSSDTGQFGRQEGEFDSDTRCAIAWFRQHGFDRGAYGEPGPTPPSARGRAVMHLAKRQAEGGIPLAAAFLGQVPGPG